MLQFHQPASSPFFFFFFNNTATTEIYTLSLHDALPILNRRLAGNKPLLPMPQRYGPWIAAVRPLGLQRYWVITRRYGPLDIAAVRALRGQRRGSGQGRGSMNTNPALVWRIETGSAVCSASKNSCTLPVRKRPPTRSRAIDGSLTTMRASV